MMKAAVFSDTHSNTALMVEAVARCRPDLIIHLGDHSRDTAILREKFPEIPLYSVRGKMDKALKIARLARIAKAAMGEEGGDGKL